MTTWGGHDVARFARKAGFTGEDVRRAVVVAYAATGWNDHYQHDVPGSPQLSQWGLFATWPSALAAPDQRSLFDPQASADDAYRYWAHFNRTWDWAPVVGDNGGAAVKAAWATIDRHHLWGVKARQMPGAQVPFGHPRGIVPPWPLKR